MHLLFILEISSWLDASFMWFGLLNQCDRIKDFNICFQKSQGDEGIHLIVDNDFMLQIEGALPSKKVCSICISFQNKFSEQKIVLFLNLALLFLVQVGNDGATRSLIKETFGFKSRLHDYYRKLQAR